MQLVFTNCTFMLPCIVIDFFLNNQPDPLIIQIHSVIKLYIFQASSFPIIRSFPLYIRHWKVSCRFWWPLPSRVKMKLQFLPDCAWKWSSKTFMQLPSVECTVENAWWWAKKMPKTCSFYIRINLDNWCVWLVI